MIQYQYVHKRDGYMTVLSIPSESERYWPVTKQFEAIRTSLSGEPFVYAVEGENFYLLKISNNGGTVGFFGQGVKGKISETQSVPVRYVDKLLSSPGADADEKVLPEFRWPALGYYAANFSAMADYMPLFGKFIRAVTNPARTAPVVLVTRDRELAESFIGLMSYLLPEKKVKQIGFALGLDRVPEGPVQIFDEESNGRTLKIDICCVRPGAVRIEDRPAFPVIDADRMADNVDASGALAAYLSDPAVAADPGRFRDELMRYTDADGELDERALARTVAIERFYAEHTPERAKAILGLRPAGADFPVFIDALECLLGDPAAALSHSREIEACLNMLKGERPDSEEISAAEDSLFDLFTRNYFAAGTDKEFCRRAVLGDRSGEKFALMIDNLLASPRGERLLSTYDEALSVYAEILEKRSAYSEETYCNFTRIFAEKFAIPNLYSLSGGNDRLSQKTFERLRERPETAKHVLAVLVLAEYLFGTDETRFARQQGFAAALEREHDEKGDLSAFQKLSVVVEVKEETDALFDEVFTEADASRRESLNGFLYDDVTVRWMKGLLKKLNFEELLDLNDLLFRQRAYKLTADVRARLLDPSAVKANVTASSPIRDRYVRFFNLSAGDREIEEYLNRLQEETGLNAEFSKYRYDFVYFTYQSMSDRDRKQVTKKAGEVPFDKNHLDAHKDFIETIIGQFGMVTKKNHAPGYASPVALWGVGFALLSLLILMIPAFVIPAALGTLSMQTFLVCLDRFMHPALFLVPIGVFVIEIVAYILCKEGRRIERANRITLFVGILPEIVLIVAYLLYYFLNVPFIV